MSVVRRYTPQEIAELTEDDSVGQTSATRWWVYSEEDDGQVVKASTASEAVARWATFGWTGIEDDRIVHALGVEHHFDVRRGR